MRKNPSYTALLRPTSLIISEKSATYTIKWSYAINWQVRAVIERPLCSRDQKWTFYFHLLTSFCTTYLLNDPLQIFNVLPARWMHFPGQNPNSFKVLKINLERLISEDYQSKYNNLHFILLYLLKKYFLLNKIYTLYQRFDKQKY